MCPVVKRVRSASAAPVSFLPTTAMRTKRPFKTARILSDASFGIYLVHVFILTALLQWIVPLMPEAWPVALRVFLTWFLTAGGAAAISILLMKTPVLSHLVGRSAQWHSSKEANALQEWFSNPFHRPREVERKERSGDAQHV